MMNKALNQRYSTSKNYYYKREINALIYDEKTPACINYYDIMTWIEDESYFKKFYPQERIEAKKK